MGFQVYLCSAAGPQSACLGGTFDYWGGPAIGLFGRCVGGGCGSQRAYGVSASQLELPAQLVFLVWVSADTVN